MTKVRQKFRSPKVYWGFPVKSEDVGCPPLRNRKHERGIALLMAILVVTIVFTFTSDLVITSRVTVENSMRHRDNVKAEYMARSAVNLAIFLLSADLGIDLFLAGPSSPLPQKPQPADGLGDIWAMINGIPIGGGTLEMMTATQEKFDLSTVNDDKVLDTLKLFDGEFVINIEDETSKININGCAKGRCLSTLAQIEALMSCPVETEYLKDRDFDPKKFSYLIKDWVDNDTKASSETTYNDEDDPYANRKPKLKSKSAPFDSIDELNLIEGWDDDLHKIFSPYLTVYPFKKASGHNPKINFNTASRELLGCIFAKEKIDCNEKFQLGLKERKEKPTNLDEKTIKSYLQENFCLGKNAGDGGDDKKRGDWFTSKSSTFKITASGDVEGQQRKIEAYIHRGPSDPKEKIKRWYKFYHWRLY